MPDEIEYLTVERVLSALKGDEGDKEFVLAILSERELKGGRIKVDQPGGLYTPVKWEGHYTSMVWRIAE